MQQYIMIGKISGRGNIRRGKVWSGKCPLRECSSGKCHRERERERERKRERERERQREREVDR